MKLYNPAYSVLSRADEQAAEAVIESYAAQSDRGPSAPIESSLPDAGPLRDAVLVELVHIDLESRLRRGEDVSFREYVERFPRLSELGDALVGIARTEWDVRQELGRPVRIETILGPNPQGSADSGLVASTGSLGVGGRFRVIRELGAGAFGRVLLCEDSRLERRVALKVPHVHPYGQDLDPRLLEQEARTAARLQHSSIVRIFELAECSGWPVLVNEYVEGMDLRTLLKSNPVAPREAAELIRQVATAVQYAHEQGITHQDLKPSNVLIDSTGRPMLTDFGLARMTMNVGSSNEDRRLSGTPAYLAPELSNPGGARDGRLCDQYSLGVMLRELLTGSPRSFRPVLETDSSGAPQPAGESNRQRFPADLVAIAEKATATNPLNRYESVGDLSSDLERFLKHYPVKARDLSLLRRSVLLARRNRFASIAVVLTTCVITVTAMRWSHSDSDVVGHADVNAPQQRQFQIAQDALAKLADSIRAMSSTGADPSSRLLLKDATRHYSELLDATRQSGSAINRRLLAESYLDVADHLLAAGELAESRSSMEQALRLIDAPVSPGGDSGRVEALRIHARLLLARILAQQPESANAVAGVLDEAQKLAAEGLKRTQNSLEARSVAAQVQMAVALDHFDSHRWEQGAPLLDQAISEFEVVTQRQPAYEHAWHLATGLYRRAQFLKSRKQDAAGCEDFLKAERVFSKDVLPLVGDNSDFRVHCLLAAAECALNTGAVADVERYTEACLHHLEEQPASSRSMQTRAYEAKACFFRAVAATRSDRPTEAVVAFELAIERFLSLCRESPSAKTRRDLAAAYHGAANANEQIGNFQAALRGFVTAAEIRAELCRQEPQLSGTVSDLLGTLHRIGELADRSTASEATLREIHSLRGWIQAEGSQLSGKTDQSGRLLNLHQNLRNLSDSLSP